MFPPGIVLVPGRGSPGIWLTGRRADTNVGRRYRAARSGRSSLRAWLAYLWYRLEAGLWVVPALLIAASIVLALVTLALDHTVSVAWPDRVDSVFAIGPEGARLLLSTIAGSMITVASLVFSMTLVTLQLASSQLGPRLITRFMRDRVNQVVLGTFIATFLYALLVLQTVTEGGARPFVPHISIAVALVLTLLSLGWLVYFIHHVADSIQADTVIAEVYQDLSHMLDRMHPAQAGVEVAAEATEPLPTELLAQAPVPAPGDGYVQAIDEKAFLSLARERDLVIETGRRPGQFALAGQPLLRIWSRAGVDEAALAAAAHKVVLGPKRTPTQDLEFALGVLVEITLRALSPGINDPRTALTCIGRLAAALTRLMRASEPQALRYDADGALRLITRPTTWEGAIDVAFNQIRQAAAGHPAVLIRLGEALAELAAIAATDRQREALARHADMLRRACRRSIPERDDRADAERRLRSLDAALAREPGPRATGPFPEP
jgi:uncharacterized membrane protein